MSLAFESPTRGNGTSEAYFTPLNMPSIINNTTEDTSNNSSVNTPYYTAPINPSLHQDFLNAIQARHATQPTVLTSPSIERPIMNLSMGSLASRRQSMATKEIIPSIDATKLNQLLQQQEESLLVLDVRSFVQYSHSRIRASINISIPNTILKRPTFTLDKVYEAIVQDQAREKLKSWEQAKSIVFYDQSSMCLQENSASAYLATKLMRAGFQGQLYYLKGIIKYK
jgi:protein-tyrosine phosphatase